MSCLHGNLHRDLAHDFSFQTSYRAAFLGVGPHGVGVGQTGMISQRLGHSMKVFPSLLHRFAVPESQKQLSCIAVKHRISFCGKDLGVRGSEVVCSTLWKRSPKFIFSQFLHAVSFHSCSM